MQLSGDLIYYWIKKEFPEAIHVNSGKTGVGNVGRPLFYDSPGNCGSHVVIAGRERSGQFVHPLRDVLPVFLDWGGDYGGECIIIPGPPEPGRVFNTLQRIFDRFDAWQRELEEAAGSLFSFDAIIRSCDSLLDEPMALSDTQFRYVSYSRQLAGTSGYEAKYVDGGSYLPLEYINRLTAMPDFKLIEQYRDIFRYSIVGDMLHKNIFFRGEYVGRLSLPNSPQEYKTRYHRQMLLVVSGYVERLYDSMGSFWHRKALNSKLGLLLRDLLDGRQVESGVLRRLLQSQGWQEGDRYLLIRMKSHFTVNEDKFTAALTTQLEKLWPGACCVPHRDALVVFLNQSHYDRSTGRLFTQELAVFLRESLLLAGISRSFTDVEDILAAWQQTEIALEAGEQRDPTYWYFKYDDYAYYDLLRHGCRDFTPEQICDPAINILRRYDRDNNTELDRTLRVYIKKQYNAVAAAEALCVARSTFLKRFARIQELTGIDLEEPRRRIYLALSYELFALHYDGGQGSI